MQQQDRRKQLIQFIHIGKGKLGMDNDTYRTFLLNTVGKESCSQMTVKELETVFDGMKVRGFLTYGQDDLQMVNARLNRVQSQ